MATWKHEQIKDQPEVKLTKWMVIEVQSNIWKGKTRHFVGYCEGEEGEEEFHVSQAINAFDKDTRRGLSRLNQSYGLIGKSGIDEKDVYILRRWLTTNEIKRVVEIDGQSLG